MGFPSTYNISYYRGDTYDFIINPKNSDGTNFDLTNFLSENALFTVAMRSGSSDTFVFNGDIEVNSDSSYIRCGIPASSGSTLSSGSTYFYDVEVKSASTTYTLLTGRINVTNDISGRVT
jgi:hypothetical protein